MQTFLYTLLKRTVDNSEVETDLEMDKNFLQELRDLKSFSDKDIADEHKSAVFAEIKAKESKELAKIYDAHIKVDYSEQDER